MSNPSDWKVVKVTRLEGNAASLKHQGRYDASRENEQGQRVWRETLSRDGGDETRASFYAWAEERVREYPHAYSVVMNPGEGRMDRETMTDFGRLALAHAEVKHGHLEYRFWIHDDHTQHSHVHALVLSHRPLSDQAIRGLRFDAGQAWREASGVEREKDSSRSLERTPTDQRTQRERLNVATPPDPSREPSRSDQDARGDRGGDRVGQSRAGLER